MGEENRRGGLGALKRIAQAMCVVLVIAGLPRSLSASGEKATAAEDAKYAALEAASPEAAAFEGGDAGLWLALLVMLLLAWTVHASSAAMRSPLDAEDPAPPLFR